MKNILPASLLAAVVLMTLAGTARAQTPFIEFTPVDVTGFNVDAILSGGTDGVNGDVSGPGGGGYHYYTAEYAAEHPGFSGDPTLPDNGIIDSASAPTEFQLQPYTQNNMLSIGGASGTLTLTPAAAGPYSEISLLLNNISQTQSTASFTFNFDTGPSTTFTTSNVVPYWAGGVPSSSIVTEPALRSTLGN